MRTIGTLFLLALAANVDLIGDQYSGEQRCGDGSAGPEIGPHTGAGHGDDFGARKRSGCGLRKLSTLDDALGQNGLRCFASL